MPEIKLIKFNQFIRLAQFFYWTMGIEPYKSTKAEKAKTKKWVYLKYLYYYAQITNLTLLFSGEIIYSVLGFYRGTLVIEAIMTLAYIGFVAAAEFKLVLIWRKKKELTTFMNELESMFPMNKPEQNKLQVRNYLKQCSFVTITFSFLYMLLIWTYNLFAILQYWIHERWLHLKIVGRVLPYTIWTPFDSTAGWLYYVSYVSHCSAGYVAAAGHISSDLLLSAAATQLIMHYDHISRELEAYKPEGMKNGKKNLAIIQKDEEFLNNLIVYHNKVLKLSDMVNNIFGVPLLLNFLISSFVICFIGFQLTMKADPDLFFKLALFLFSSLAQVYLICYYGQLLADSSTNIAQAIYNQDWMEADISYKKTLSSIIQRAQKPAFLKATFFIAITKESMTEILQVSYKFFALLRTMFARNNPL